MFILFIPLAQLVIHHLITVWSIFGNRVLVYPIILQARAAGTAVEGQSREEETEEDHPRV